MKLLFASNNKHKCNEMSELFKINNINNIELIFPFDLSVDKLEVIENGNTYKDNALIKAKAFFEKFQIPCFSDDSGLEVFSLNSEPGLNSARYSGKVATDESNREKLLLNLKNIEERNARFVCVICLYNGINTEYFEGFVNGKIISSELGANGFGYDPLFIPEGFSTTFAEMNDDEKNKISHRANAVSSLNKILRLL